MGFYGSKLHLDTEFQSDIIWFEDYIRQIQLHLDTEFQSDIICVLVKLC